MLLCCCRDSGQPDVFFTLSYQSDDGPTSVRVQLNNLLFSLYGSQRTFASLFALLTYYTGSSCKLTVPYRKQRPERLKQMCRRALIRAYGAENISTFPGLSTQVKDYVHAYPCCIQTHVWTECLLLCQGVVCVIMRKTNVQCLCYYKYINIRNIIILYYKYSVFLLL